LPQHQVKDHTLLFKNAGITSEFIGQDLHFLNTVYRYLKEVSNYPLLIALSFHFKGLCHLA